MKIESTTINGYEYTVQAVSARVGVRMQARLAQALAPAMASLPTDGFEVTPESIARLIAPVLQDDKLSGTLDYLIDSLQANTTVKDLSTGNTLPLERVFDVRFSDDYEALYMWLAFALKVSMSSFFGSVLSHVAQAQAVGRSASKSPSSPETTGQSGGSA